MIYRHFSIAGLNKIIIAIDIELDEDKESSSIEFLGIYQLPFFEVFFHFWNFTDQIIGCFFIRLIVRFVFCNCFFVVINCV